MENKKRFNVYSITQKNNPSGAVWARAGTAFTNRDGSLNIYLDVLPLEGQLHLREATVKRQDEDSDAIPVARDDGMAMRGH